MLAAVGSKNYPRILSTYRLTEHHLSGSMSGWLPWLAELQPELLPRSGPEHAEELGIGNTELIKISTPRGAIQAKAYWSPNGCGRVSDQRQAGPPRGHALALGL